MKYIAYRSIDFVAGLPFIKLDPGLPNESLVPRWTRAASNGTVGVNDLSRNVLRASSIRIRLQIRWSALIEAP